MDKVQGKTIHPDLEAISEWPEVQIAFRRLRARATNQDAQGGTNPILITVQLVGGRTWRQQKKVVLVYDPLGECSFYPTL